jgi:hypothetical protein
MKTIEKIAKKQMYNSPAIVCVELDNEISLALESSPPLGPDETLSSVQNPFKENIG